MLLEELTNEVNELVYNFIQSAEIMGAKRLGLDERAGHQFWVTDEYIAVEKSEVRSLDYYGGFEYVDDEFRKELGDYVFFSADDDRVSGHIADAFGYKESEDDGQPDEAQEWNDFDPDC